MWLSLGVWFGPKSPLHMSNATASLQTAAVNAHLRRSLPFSPAVEKHGIRVFRMTQGLLKVCACSVGQCLRSVPANAGCARPKGLTCIAVLASTQTYRRSSFLFPPWCRCTAALTSSKTDFNSLHFPFRSPFCAEPGGAVRDSHAVHPVPAGQQSADAHGRAEHQIPEYVQFPSCTTAKSAVGAPV